MNYLGKVGGIINNTLTGTQKDQPNNQLITDLQIELKRRDKMVKQFQQEAKKLKDDNEFINKAYEELEAQFEKEKQIARNVSSRIGDCVNQVEVMLGTVGQKVSTKLYENIVGQLDQKIGEKLVQIQVQIGTQTQVQKDNKINLILNFDCTQLLTEQFTPILARILTDLDSPNGSSPQEELLKLEQKLLTTVSTHEEEMSKLKSQWKEAEKQLDNKLKQRQEQLLNKLMCKQEQLKMYGIKNEQCLLLQQKIKKIEKQLNGSKINIEKYQKQIFTKCQDNNELIQKNNQLITNNNQLINSNAHLAHQIQKLKVEVQTLNTQITQPQSDHISDIQIQQLNNQNKQLQSSLQLASNMQQQYQQQIQSAKSQTTQAKQLINKLNANIQGLQDSNSIHQQKTNNIKQQFNIMRDVVKQLSGGIKGLLSFMEQLKSSQESYRQQIKNAWSQIQIILKQQQQIKQDQSKEVRQIIVNMNDMLVEKYNNFGCVLIEKLQNHDKSVGRTIERVRNGLCKELERMKQQIKCKQKQIKVKMQAQIGQTPKSSQSQNQHQNTQYVQSLKAQIQTLLTQIQQQQQHKQQEGQRQQQTQICGSAQLQLCKEQILGIKQQREKLREELNTLRQAQQLHIETIKQLTNQKQNVKVREQERQEMFKSMEKCLVNKNEKQEEQLGEKQLRIDGLMEEIERNKIQINDILAKCVEMQNRSNHKITQLQTQSEQSHTLYQQLNNTHTQSLSQIQSLNHQLQSSTQLTLQQTSDISIKAQTITKLQQQITNLTSQLQTQKEHKRQLGEQVSGLNAEIQELKGDLQMMKSMSSTVDEQYQKLIQAETINKQHAKVKQVFECLLEVQLNEEGIRVVSERIKKAQQQVVIGSQRIDWIERDCCDLRKVIEERSKEIEQLGMHVDKLNGEVSYKQQQNKAVTNQLQTSNNTNVKTIQTLKQTLKVLQQQNSQFKAQNNHLQQNFNTTKQSLDQSKQNAIHLSTELQQLQKQMQQTQKQITNINSKKNESEQAAKKQVQGLKNKNSKLEAKFAEAASNSKDLKDKISKLEAQVNEYRIEEDKWKKSKEQLNEKVSLKDQQLQELQTGMENALAESAQKLNKQKTKGQKELCDKEEIWKNEKASLDRKYQTQIERLKSQIKKRQAKIIQTENQTKQAKQRTTQEKKVVAMLNGRLQEMRNSQTRVETLEGQIMELKTKMMMKEEELKKGFTNIQNLKSTISELEQGIDTYQRFAEDVNREIQNKKQELQQNQTTIQRLNLQNQTLKQKLNQHSHFYDVFTNGKSQLNKNQIGQGADRKEIILPIKRLFLKYFDPSSNYEQKVNTLSTLSEVLELDRKQSEVLKNYKRTKLTAPDSASKQKTETAIQNKFFDFLISD